MTEPNEETRDWIEDLAEIEGVEEEEVLEELEELGEPPGQPESGDMPAAPEPVDEEEERISSVEIAFAVPVILPDGWFRTLYEMVDQVARAEINTPNGCVHWCSGGGSKPRWSKADAAFLGVAAEPDAPEGGEPIFDHSILRLETCCRRK